MTEAAGLPDPVRKRVVGLAAQALGQLPVAQVPVPLRKSAGFAPARRTRLVASQLLTALGDDEFRERIAVQVRSLAPVAARLLDEAQSPDDLVARVAEPDLPEAVALAYLLRWPGLDALVELLAPEGAAAETGTSAARLPSPAAIERKRAEVEAGRAKARARADELKAHNRELRTTVGALRAQLKQVRSEGEALAARFEAAQQAADTAARTHDSEVRRLLARVTTAESAQAALRRAVRDDREAEVMRLRLLLDTVVDAAAGLRRELGLPASDLLPADTVVAVEPADPALAHGTGRWMADDDPALLRQLLMLPHVHLIVDGYNVSKTAWPSSPLDQQRNRLTGGLSSLASGKRVEVTVVFDGAELVYPPAVSSPRGVRVRFSAPGTIADDLIRQLVEAEPAGRPLVVVSSDKEVARTVAKRGARALTADALVKAMRP